MKKTFQNNAGFLLIILILGIGIGMVVNGSQQEGFSLPAVNQVYNPIVRKIRNYITEKKNSFSSTMKVFFKRVKLI